MIHAHFLFSDNNKKQQQRTATALLELFYISSRKFSIQFIGFIEVKDNNIGVSLVHPLSRCMSAASFLFTKQYETTRTRKTAVLLC
jgi:hypothetical protein